MDIVSALLKVALLGSAWVLYALLVASLASVGVMIERAWFFRRNGRGGGDPLRRRVVEALVADDPERARKILRDSDTVEGTCVANAMAFRSGGRYAFGDALDAEIVRARRKLDRGMNYLGTLGSNSPFLGLFGTVIGVIGAFHELGSASAKAGAMGGVMASIAEALVATGVGIFVALPAVAAYNMGQKKIGDVEGDAVNLGKLVSAWIETKERGGTLDFGAEPQPAVPAPALDANPAVAGQE